MSDVMDNLTTLERYLAWLILVVMIAIEAILVASALSLLALILDGILVHIANSLAPGSASYSDVYSFADRMRVIAPVYGGLLIITSLISYAKNLVKK